jgi:hypothetical protein
MKKERPAGVVVVRAHGGGSAAASHGIVIVGIGFCCGKSGFRLHELWTRYVGVVVATAIAATISVAAKHDVLFSLLSHYHSRCLFVCLLLFHRFRHQEQRNHRKIMQTKE